MATTLKTIAERRLLVGLHQASRRAASEIEAAIAEQDMRLRPFMVLGLLDEVGELSQQAVGAKLGIDRTTMVATVDELERRGLVERHRRAEDRRQYSLCITDQGRKMRTKLEKTADDVEERLLSGLSDDVRVALRAGLVHLATCGDPPPCEVTERV